MGIRPLSAEHWNFSLDTFVISPGPDTPRNCTGLYCRRKPGMENGLETHVLTSENANDTRAYVEC